MRLRNIFKNSKKSALDIPASSLQRLKDGKDGIFIQIGAGAGDQDPGARFRDGFAEFVKSLPVSHISEIHLVEPNPFNHLALNEAWRSYDQAKMWKLAIVPKRDVGKKLNLYYTPNDAPHYQVASIDPKHVLKHYKKQSINDLRTFEVETVSLEEFVEKSIGNRPIKIIGLDIEGLDYEVAIDTDFSEINAQFISMEYIHLGIRRNWSQITF